MAIYYNEQNQITTEEYYAIAYYRLSKDDGARHESDSIANQRKLVQGFRGTPSRLPHIITNSTSGKNFLINLSVPA